ncbi:MAG: hypothetical protein JJU45_15135 [Acidimicrobiia bacterium]|nr:hypothetical protein [Acidimicrobiia bacterium]
MKRLFRPRNLIILFGLGVIIGIVVSKKNSAPAPTYPDPWATPEASSGNSNESSSDSDAAASNGAAAASETANQGSGS